MSFSNVEHPVFCGQCGTRLLTDKTCPNISCIAFGGTSSPSYNSTDTAMPFKGLQNSPITPRLHDSGLYDPTRPAYITQPSPRSQKNTNLRIVLAVLVLLLIAFAFFELGQLLKNPQGTASNTLNTPDHPGTTPGIVNTAATSAITTPTSVQPTPSPTPMPPGTVFCNTANPGQGWDKWNLVSGWKVLNGKLLYDGTGNGERMVVPDFCQPTTPNYAVDIKMRIVAACCHFGITMRGSASSTGYNGYQLSIYTTTFQNVNISTLGGQGGGSVGYSFDNNFHIYRGEVKDNVVNFVIDGAKVLSVTDNTYLSPGEISICCTDTMELEITSFKVTAL